MKQNINQCYENTIPKRQTHPHALNRINCPQEDQKPSAPPGARRRPNTAASLNGGIGRSFFSAAA